MQKSLSSIQNENRPASKATIVTIATVLTCGTLLWLGALMTQSKERLETSPARHIFADKATDALETKRTEHFETDKQIIISYAPRETTTRAAAAYHQFAREISLATQALDSSNSKVNEIIQQLTSAQACLTMTYLMAKDFFTDSADVEEMFKTETEELDRVTMNAVDQAKQAVDRLHSALQMTEGVYTEMHTAGPERLSPTGAPENTSNQKQTSEMPLLALNQTISLASTIGSASAMISATALARTVTRRVGSMLAEARLTAAKRMTTAALPAIADGPLPFGDTVTLALESGSLFWSFREVYHAQGTLKNDLQQELSEAMRQNSKNIHAWAMSVGNELLESVALSTQK